MKVKIYQDEGRYKFYYGDVAFQAAEVTFAEIDRDLDEGSVNAVENRAVARALAAQEARIDEALAAKTPPDNSELADVRVDALGGVWKTAGNAVRSIVKSLVDDVYHYTYIEDIANWRQDGPPNLHVLPDAEIEPRNALIHIELPKKTYLEIHAQGDAQDGYENDQKVGDAGSLEEVQRCEWHTSPAATEYTLVLHGDGVERITMYRDILDGKMAHLTDGALERVNARENQALDQLNADAQQHGANIAAQVDGHIGNLNTVANGLLDAINGAANGAIGNVNGAADSAINNANNAINATKDGAIGALNGIKDACINDLNNLKGVIIGDLDGIKATATNDVNAAAAAAIENANAAVNAAIENANAAIGAAQQNAVKALQDEKDRLLAELSAAAK